MKFAMMNGERQEPQPGLVARCPGCGQEVIARCGEVKVWHWAHKGRRTCDPWWEPETAWHRAWKNLFPAEWQEIPMRAEDEGLHIADVRTPQGLVLEFQHSAIEPEERRTREAFYGKMIWVVDGTRLTRDRPRIDANLPGWRYLDEGFVKLSAWPSEFLPKGWLESAAPVVFDFDGLPREFDDDDRPVYAPDWEGLARPDPLICLLPGRYRGRALYFPINRVRMAKVTSEGTHLFDSERMHQKLRERDAMTASKARHNRRFTGHRSWPKR